MKNRKQLLADFYLELLSVDDQTFRIVHARLYASIKNSLAYELDSEEDIIQNIFERMAAEDGK